MTVMRRLSLASLAFASLLSAATVHAALDAGIIVAEILYVPRVTRLFDPSALPPLEGQAKLVAIGFSLVIMLMVVGTWNDLVRVATVVFGG